jgi:hypothetical protein
MLRGSVWKHAFEGGERQQRRDVALLEISLHQIFVEVRGDDPQHRAGNAKASHIAQCLASDRGDRKHRRLDEKKLTF